MAPGFHEIERNIWYVEREDEFEEEFKDQKQIEILSKWENKHKHNGLYKLEERQRELAQNSIDIDTKASSCITIQSTIQAFAEERPDLKNLDKLYSSKSKSELDISPLNIMSFLPVHVSTQDCYAKLARDNLSILREKYNNLL